MVEIYVEESTEESIKKIKNYNLVDYKRVKVIIVLLTIFWKWITPWIPTIFSIYHAHIQG